MSINLRILTLLFILGLSSVASNSQTQSGLFTSSFYSLNEGLSDRLIRDIHQNKQGFLWMATSNGLNKFDGYEFKVFDNQWDNPYRISDIGPQQIEEDKYGNLVLIYPNNITFFDLFDPSTYQVKKVLTTIANGIKGLVQKIVVDHQGNIFVLSLSNSSGLYLYSYDQGTFTEVFHQPEHYQKVNLTFDLLRLQNGNFLLNDNEKGLRKFDDNGKLIKKYQASDFRIPSDKLAYPGKANIFHQDRMGRIWLTFAKTPGLMFKPIGEESFLPHSKVPDSQLFTSLWEDLRGNILVAQTNGIGINPIVNQLYCLTPDQQFHDFSYLLDISEFIISIYSKNFFQTIFMGIDTGLKIVQNNQYKVQTYLARNVGVDERGAVMRGIAQIKAKEVYVAREVNTWYKLYTEEQFLDTLPIYDVESGNRIQLSCGMDIQFDPKGNLWGIACNDGNTGMLIQYDTASCNAQVFHYPEQFNAFQIAQDGRIWLVYRGIQEKGGLVVFNPDTGEFTNFKDREGKNPLKNATPRYIIESQKHHLWVGTENGLFKIDPRIKMVTSYRHDEKQPANSLSSDVIWVVHEADDGCLWLGTSKGLNIFDPETEKSEYYDKKDGLASNLVCGILPDEKGNYWISTYNGLSYFNVKKKLFRNFFSSDGLSNDEFNRFSFHKDEKGQFYFGGVNGLNVFHPENLLVQKEIPKAMITRIVRSNAKEDTLIIRENGLDELTKLYISPQDNYFQIHFTIPVYSNPSKNQYKVWLEGYEKDWTFLGNASFVRYNRLPAGTYYLHIRGADSNGNWSKPDRVIRVEIGEVFYRTWWFILLVLLGIVGIIFAVFKYQLEQQLQVERFRTKLSSDLHDEVSGLLSGIAMQTDVLQMLVKDDISQKRIKAIGEVSRKAMSKMNDVIWSIDSRKDKVEDLVNRMQEHADDILGPLNIHYDLHINNIELNQKIPVGIRQDIYFIYKESINNVAKHSNATRVNIELGNEGGNFELIIKDNGDGNGKLKKTHKKGQGISNLKMRANRIQANLQIKHERGYTVQLKMRKFS